MKKQSKIERTIEARTGVDSTSRGEDGCVEAEGAGNAELGAVRDYWNAHLNATQFLGDEALEEGSPEFYDALESTFERFPYKQSLFDWMAALPGGILLEIGCGLGNDLVDLARRGVRVTGIDLAPRAVELARKHLALRGQQGDVRIENCEKLDLPSESFDIVYSSGVIQHTPNIDAAVDEIRRVLKPGGTMVVILYHRYSWFNLLKSVSRRNIEFEDAEAPIIRTFSKRQLRRLFARVGDATIRMEHFRPSATPRGGTLSFLFNRVFVPAYGALPAALIRPFGWHAVVKARRK